MCVGTVQLALCVRVIPSCVRVLRLIGFFRLSGSRAFPVATAICNALPDCRLSVIFWHRVETFLGISNPSAVSVKLHLGHKQTKRQTDRRRESNLVHFFSLKM